MEREAKVKEAEVAAEVVEVVEVVEVAEVAEVREVAEKKTNQKLNQNTTKKRKIQSRCNKHFTILDHSPKFLKSHFLTFVHCDVNSILKKSQHFLLQDCHSSNFIFHRSLQYFPFFYFGYIFYTFSFFQPGDQNHLTLSQYCYAFLKIDK